MDRSRFDIIVVGAGHAGCEAALAAARMGARTALLTINLDSVAYMSCNPAIGGLAKGQIVREIDALGGEMAKVIDATGIQFRMINTSKGPAMHSPRAQADKSEYNREMKCRVESRENLQLKQELVEHIVVSDNKIAGVRCKSGAEYQADAVVLTTGTFLRGVLYCGSWRLEGGRMGEMGAERLSSSLEAEGIKIARFQTTTPPRVNGRTLDFGRMKPQHGDESPKPFSFSNPKIAERNQVPCYMTYTAPRTHEVIRAGLEDMTFGREWEAGSAPRYCPSIETKVVRFKDKDSHLLFIEPEGRKTHEYYCNGLFTCLSGKVQEKMIRTIPGLENAEIMRYGYGVQYDYIPPVQLMPSLESKKIGGLFHAGQINGTSGYEEAAAQGLLAGINAAKKLQGKEPLILGREEAYIGVLIDDLVTNGTDEPYRMFTSLAEYRLLLRQDNADRRLMKYGHENGLISSRQWAKLQKKEKIIQKLWTFLEENQQDGDSLAKMLRRPEMNLENLSEIIPDLKQLLEDKEACQQVEIEARYAGYFERQKRQIDKVQRLEDKAIPQWIDYNSIKELRNEAKEKLSRVKPRSLGQASRISGISPADVSIVMLYIA